MNYIKIQKKILDNFLKGLAQFPCLTLDDYYLISDNTFQIFRIPKSEMWLDVKKMMKGRQEMTSLEKIMQIEGEDGVLTGDAKQAPNGIVVKVASTNNIAWVDKKLLERFEIKNGLHFTVSDAKKPLLVWEGEQLCGLICPVNVKEGD